MSAKFQTALRRRTRRWSWLRPWRGSRPYSRYAAIYCPVDADIIRAVALWPTIFNKIPESEPACSARWETADVHRELRPRFGVSSHCVGRIDIQQQISEIANVGRCCPYVNARAICTHPNLQPIRKRRRFHCTRVERQRIAILQTQFRR